MGSLLVGAAIVLLWVGSSRLRGRGFPNLPRWGGLVLLGLAPVAVVGAVVVPGMLGPRASGPRPASTATIAFVRPSPDATVEAGELAVELRLDGGTVVEQTTTVVAPDTGHIHLFLDGNIVSMSYGLVQEVPIEDLAPGPHRLQAEFVAADHVPFDPRVTATIVFVKEGP